MPFGIKDQSRKKNETFATFDFALDKFNRFFLTKMKVDDILKINGKQSSKVI